jgi:hypothetical protein
MAEKTGIFLSYSRKDHRWVDRLLEILKPLLKEKNVSLWSDIEINPGENWHEAIESSLDRSQIVILLVSEDYLASRLVDEELSLILERSRQGKLRILSVVVSPILLAPSDLTNSIQEHQPVNSFSEPLSGLSESRQDEILMRLSTALDSSLPKSLKIAEESGKYDVDKYSTALNAAFLNIVGSSKGINILGDRNIFFEAEERLARKDDK